jgi:hypothetical protein
MGCDLTPLAASEYAFEVWVLSKTALTFQEWCDPEENAAELAERERLRKQKEYADWAWNATH